MTEDPYTYDRETPIPGVPQPGLLEANDRLRAALLAGYEELDPHHQGEAWPDPVAWDGRSLPEQAEELSGALNREMTVESRPWQTSYRAALCRCRQRLHDAMIAFALAEEREAYGGRA